MGKRDQEKRAKRTVRGASPDDSEEERAVKKRVRISDETLEKHEKGRRGRERKKESPQKKERSNEPEREGREGEGEGRKVVDPPERKWQYHNQDHTDKLFSGNMREP